MDPRKIVEFLDQYPLWFKLAFVAFLALSVLGFLTLRQPKVPTISPQAEALVTMQPSGGAPATLTEYFKVRRSLDGRFLELEDFDKRLGGQSVSWSAYVASVSTLPVDREHPIQVIVSTEAGARGDLAAVLLREDQRTRAYSFRKGDLVAFSGVVNYGGGTPSIKAAQIELRQ